MSTVEEWHLQVKKWGGALSTECIFNYIIVHLATHINALLMGEVIPGGRGTTASSCDTDTLIFTLSLLSSQVHVWVSVLCIPLLVSS